MRTHKLGKRVFSLLLTLALCLAALPLQALAEEIPPEPDPAAPEEAPASEAPASEDPAAPEDSDKTDPYALEALRPGLLTALAEDAYTRGQWLQELEQAFGLTAGEDEYPDVYYPDIEGSKFFDAVMIAVTHGLSDVEPGDPFDPEGPLTRDWAAHTLNYLLGLQPKEEGYTFSDSGDAAYPDDAQAVVDAGWLALADGSFLPGQAVTKAEAQAMLDGAAEVLAGREEAPAENGYVLADTVIQIPKDAQVETAENAVRITGFDGVIEAGNVFAFDYQGLPFVYKADYVERDEEDALVIVTSDAPEDAVVSLDFSGAVTPEVTFTPDERVVTLADGNGDPVVFGAARAVDTGRDYIKVSRSITLADGVTGSLNVDLTRIGIVPLSDGGKKGFALTGNLSVSSTVKFDMLNDRAAAELPLGQLGLEPFGSVSLSIQLKMEAKMSYSYSGALRVGVYYRDAFTPDVSFRNGQTTLSADGTASAKLALKGQMSIPFIASASVQASVGPVIKASAHKYSSGTPQTCVTIAGYLEAGASVNAKFGLKSYNKNFPIYTEKNSPIRVYEHVEDGRTVYACTRGNESGGSGGYTPPKYISPGNSRIYASGSSSGSSTWTGGGSAEPVVIWTTEANENGGVTVTGYKGGASVLNIPETIDGETVTEIGERAFWNNTNIRIVNMPDTVTSIGSEAFRGCSSLRAVTFSENLTEIGSWAFQDCASLTRADLPEGLTRLGGTAFGSCESLTYAYIPSTLKEAIGVFLGCGRLDSIKFGPGIAAIPGVLFQNCPGLTHIEIPDTVSSIGGSAFRNCGGLRSVRLGESLTEIGSDAFSGCSGITRIEIPDTVVSIGDGAFLGCSGLASVTFGESVTKIGGWAFQDCAALTSADLPEGLTELGGWAFRNCAKLNHAYIPSTLESGFVAFSGCSSLDDIEFGPGIAAIPENLFQECTGLTHIEIPDTVTAYGADAYLNGVFQNCANLAAATLSKNALNISPGMFSGCTSLKTVNLPDGVTEIKPFTFQNCAALESLDFLPASVTSIGSDAFRGCASLTSPRLPAAVTVLGNGCFRDCAALTGVTLNRGLREIGSYAFQNCAALEEITLPDTVASIGSYIFQGNPKLARVTLSKGLAEIPSYAFANCTALERLDIPQGVKTVKDHAFYQDTALKTFTIPQSVTSIESNAFSYPTTTTVYGVPGSYAETFARWKEFIPITVVPVTGLVLDRTELTLTEGGSQTLTAQVLPGDATNRTVLWSTNNTAVVEVSPDGAVTAKKAGWATITARTADGGYEAVCAVTVTAAPVQPDPEPPSGNTMGPKNELTWEREGRAVTVTGPVSAAEPLWAAAYDQNGRLLFLGQVTASGGSVSLPAGAASVRLIWTDPGRAPKCASVPMK